MLRTQEYTRVDKSDLLGKDLLKVYREASLYVC